MTIDEPELEEDEIGFRVGISDGKIVIDFGEPVAWIAMDPWQAKEFGEMIAEIAREAEQ